MIHNPRLLSALVCPRCHSSLQEEADELCCHSCGRRYPVCEGIPYLRSAPPSAAESQYLRGIRGRLRRRPLLYRWPFRLFAPVLVTGPNGANRLAPLADGEGLVIDLGAGNDRRHPRFLNVDLLPYPEVDLLCDGEALPFASGSIDGVLSIAVFEHVERLEHMLDEVHRVLRSGGRLFVAVPFLQPFHAAPHDYRRWTLTGLGTDLENCYESRPEAI